MIPISTDARVWLSERRKDAGVVPSVGSVGDGYDNAVGETINGLYKAGHLATRALSQLRDG